MALLLHDAIIRQICEAALRDDLAAVERWISSGQEECGGIAVAVIARLTARDIHRIYIHSGAAPAKVYAQHRLGLLKQQQHVVR